MRVYDGFVCGLPLLQVLTIKGMPLVEHLAGVVVEEKVQEVVVGIPTRSVGRSIDRVRTVQNRVY